MNTITSYQKQALLSSLDFLCSSKSSGTILGPSSPIFELVWIYVKTGIYSRCINHVQRKEAIRKMDHHINNDTTNVSQTTVVRDLNP